ncbi:MAG: 2-C-methyl-D-erythritol 2,4-cyclodiphosphate synthase [Candidatus Eisenbacteria bacterium]
MKAPRVGFGFDSHRFEAGRPLVLGGVTIPFDRGLAGHSDADVLTHAIIDAMLGAASAGDIGRLFPDTEEKYRNASSMGLLGRALEEVRELGYRMGNIDAVVITEEPQIGPHALEIRRSIAGGLGMDEAAVSVKGKTNEEMGAIGRREGIAANAVVLIIPNGR